MDGVNISSWLGHSLSGAAILASLAGIFPPIAALAAFIWYAVQLYESKTVQTWLHTRRVRKIAELKKHMARLEAQEMKALHLNKKDNE